MNERYAWLILVCWVFMGPSMAQDAQFTQFYALPTQLSPAFAGTGVQTRMGLSWRDQWPSIPGAFISAKAGIDHYIPEMNSGVGLLVEHDRAGSGALRYTSVTGQYAYEIELKRKVFLRPALQLGWVNHAVDYTRLVFGDQLARGGTVGTYEYLQGTSVSYADVGTGLLFFTPKLWLGAAVLHLNNPNQSFLANVAPIPRKYTAHGGYRISLRSPVIKTHPESIVLAFNYRSQGKYDQLDIGGYFEREPFYAGLWYRGIPLLKRYDAGYANNDAIAVLVGLVVKDLRFGYSYDLTISRLAANTGGAHELTLGYGFAQAHKKRAATKRRIVPCAKF
jgi:type IX secretion system PorP/SprF family membrane protein